MSRYIGPVCRLCRRESIKLMLKGSRCYSAKCPMERQSRNRPPGMHFWRRGKSTPYSVRLREKQKVKRYYGVLERQFEVYFRRAERTRGIPARSCSAFWNVAWITWSGSSVLRLPKRPAKWCPMATSTSTVVGLIAPATRSKW